MRSWLARRQCVAAQHIVQVNLPRAKHMRGCIFLPLAGVLLYFGVTRGWLARLLAVAAAQLALCGVCGRSARRRALLQRRRRRRRRRGLDSDDSELDEDRIAARAVQAKAERAPEAVGEQPGWGFTRPLSQSQCVNYASSAQDPGGCLLISQDRCPTIWCACAVQENAIRRMLGSLTAANAQAFGEPATGELPSDVIMQAHLLIASPVKAGTYLQAIVQTRAHPATSARSWCRRVHPLHPPLTKATCKLALTHLWLS